MASIANHPGDEDTIRSRKPDAAASHVGAWVLLATILGSAMGFIDASAVTVALPAIQAQLGASAVGAQWIVEAYALFLAALTLLGGSLGDHLGRKRIFCVGVVIFAGASIWCGLSPGTGQLIAARAVQGVGAALLIPGSLAIISASFSQGDRGKAIGTWSAFSGISTVAGPVLGGFLVDTLSWRWVFFINVPLAVAVLAITLARVPESRDSEARRLDPLGAAFATLGLGGLILGLIESSAAGLTDPLVLFSLAGGVLALVAFVLVESRVREPMMPLSIFRFRNFTGANAFTLFLYFALGGAMYFLPFVLIQAQGYSASAAGAALVPASLLMFILSRYTGGLVDRFGPRLPLTLGPTVAAGGFVLLALASTGSGGSYWTTYFPAVMVLGLGLSVVVPALTTTALNAVTGDHSGLASGVNNAISRTANLLAVAVFGVLVFAVFSSALDSRIASLELSGEARQQLESEKVDLGAAKVPAGVDNGTAARVDAAIADSFLAGFRAVMWAAAGLALASALAAALIIRNNSPDSSDGAGEDKSPEEKPRAPQEQEA